VVVRESGEFSSIIAAGHLGVPRVDVEIALATRTADRFLSVAGPPTDDLRRRFGLAPGDGRQAPRFTLAPAALDDPEASADVRRFRAPADAGGAVVPAFGDDALPLVYLTFGTEVPSRARSYFPGLYREALDALAGLPVRVLVTIGDERDPAELGPMPSSVRVARWVPQAAVMREAAAMVGHGGAGTVLAALAAGVPMALIGLFADQPLNARQVAELGVGLALDGPAALREAVPRLLAEPGFRERAMGVATEIGELPPVDDAVDALEAYVASRRSVSASGAPSK
jgi:hypothetical protein